jgi:hypothetical protein
LFTKVLIIADDLSKYGSFGVLCVEMPYLSTTGNSMIL